jgi:hypothetical protein
VDRLVLKTMAKIESPQAQSALGGLGGRAAEAAINNQQSTINY